MSSEGLHAPRERLSKKTLAMHHAIVSLMEELEAVDWYDQRVQATQDQELRALLAHNRDEEKEHACMMIEWLRRRDPGFRAQLDTYLYCEGDILQAEAGATGGGDEAGATEDDGSLGIGSLKTGVAR